MMLEAPDVRLATRPFRIDAFLLSRATYVPLGLENAAARAAPAELDNGYFDSNTREGSTWAHGQFLIGLLAFYDERRPTMTEAQRQASRAAIERATDYLLLVTDAATGEAAHASPRRPYAADADPEDTVGAARGLARYAAQFQRENPTKAERAYRFARLADGWLREDARQAYEPGQEAAVAFDLYRYGGDVTQLDRAIQIAGELAAGYDLRTMERRGFDPSPDFETMYELWRSLPDHPARQTWIEAAARVGAQYKEMVQRNPFGVVAPGVTDPATGETPADQWDAAETDPPPGEGEAGMIGNEWFLGRAMDASYLAAMTGDEELERAATASMLWITGLNPGAPYERVVGASAASPLESASFITGATATNAGTNSVMPWSSWEWSRTMPIQSIAAGFARGWTLGDDEATSGTSIARDGAWLAAVVAYERLLQPGRLAPEPEAASKPGGEVMRVSAIERAEDGDAPSVLVTVVDVTGSRLVGAKVTAAWQGAAEAAEAALRVTQCVTAAGGSCAMALEPADALARPIAVTVTNVEHPGYPYVPPAEAVTATVR
jgi:hypothetical protein